MRRGGVVQPVVWGDRAEHPFHPGLNPPVKFTGPAAPACRFLPFAFGPELRRSGPALHPSAVPAACASSGGSGRCRFCVVRRPSCAVVEAGRAGFPAVPGGATTRPRQRPGLFLPGTPFLPITHPSSRAPLIPRIPHPAHPSSRPSLIPGVPHPAHPASRAYLTPRLPRSPRHALLPQA